MLTDEQIKNIGLGRYPDLPRPTTRAELIAAARLMNHHQLADMLDREDEQKRCLCNIGAQECPVHPDHLMSKEAKIQSRKDWDARCTD